MQILTGGNWTKEPYAPTFSLSMGYRKEEIPNIIKLSTPYGALKSLVETQREISIATHKAIEEGKLIPARCWNPHAIA